ncbi:MAG: hypothetical protein KAR47_08460, partial [Planctomycetes bacterium]|nr:hypothetical protein [Planctomycetota bacterium]
DGVNLRDDGFETGDLEPFDVYHADDDDGGNDKGLFAETSEENVQARKGPFIDLENANVYTMRDVYHQDTGSFLAGGGSGNIEDSLVLCDEYVVKRKSGKKTGMPILYYRARRLYTQQDSGDVDSGIDNNIYFYPDNESILDLGIPEDTSTDHPLYENRGGADDWLMFDNMILNMQVTQIKRPYRADSYILISAGKDGMYGTPDDMYNFEKQN